MSGHITRRDRERARESLRLVEPRSLFGRIFGVRMEADGCWFRTRAAIHEAIAQELADERDRALAGVREELLKQMQKEA